MTITDPQYYSAPFTIERAWVAGSRHHQLEYDCMENPRSEEFDHTLFVKDLYRPTCISYQGAGRSTHASPVRQSKTKQKRTGDACGRLRATCRPVQEKTFKVNAWDTELALGKLCRGIGAEIG